MKKVINKLMVAILSVSTVLTMSSCDNGSKLVEMTSVSGRVLDGVLANALVCLDTNGDYSCADEQVDYKTTTDGVGTFSLKSLPSELLKASTIVVQTRSNSADNAEVVQKILAAPGVVAYYNADDLNISALLSLVTFDMNTSGKDYISATAGTMGLFGLEGEAFDLSRLNYIQYASSNTAALALRELNSALFDNTNYDAIFDAVQSYDKAARSISSSMDADYPEQIKLTAEEHLQLLEQIVYTLEELIREVMLINLGINLDFPEGLIPQRVVSSVEEINQALDDVESGHTVDLNNLSKNIVSTAAGIASAIPGPTMVVGGVITVATFFWPETPKDYTEISQQLYQDAQNLIQNELLKNKYAELVNEFIGVRTYLVQYTNATSDKERKDTYHIALLEMKKLLDKSAGAETNNDYEAAKMLLPMNKIIFTTYFLMLREQYNYAEILDKYWDESSPEVRKNALLKEWVRVYKIYRDKFYGAHGHGGDTALYNQFLSWRMGPAFVSEVYSENCGVSYCDDERTVTDKFSDFVIKYIGYGGVFSGNGDRFEPDGLAVRIRLLSTSKLAIAKELASLAYLPRFFPQNETVDGVLVSELVPEAQGVFSTIFPEELKLIFVGPLSPGCVNFNPLDRMVLPPYGCKHSDTKSDLLPSRAGDSITDLKIYFHQLMFLRSNTRWDSRVTGATITYASGESKEYKSPMPESGTSHIWRAEEVRTAFLEPSRYLTGLSSYSSSSIYRNPITALSLESSFIENDGKVTPKLLNVESSEPVTVSSAIYKHPGVSGSLDMQVTGMSFYNPDDNGSVGMMYMNFAFTPDTWGARE